MYAISFSEIPFHCFLSLTILKLFYTSHTKNTSCIHSSPAKTLLACNTNGEHEPTNERHDPEPISTTRDHWRPSPKLRNHEHPLQMCETVYSV